MQRFRGGLVFKGHRLWYHSTLGLRVIKKKKDSHRHRDFAKDRVSLERVLSLLALQALLLPPASHKGLVRMVPDDFWDSRMSFGNFSDVLLQRNSSGNLSDSQGPPSLKDPPTNQFQEIWVIFEDCPFRRSCCHPSLVHHPRVLSCVIPSYVSRMTDPPEHMPPESHKLTIKRLVKNIRMKGYGTTQSSSAVEG